MESTIQNGTGSPDEPERHEPDKSGDTPERKTPGAQQLAGIPPVQAEASSGAKPAPEPAALLDVTDLTWESTVEKGKIPVAVMFYSPACTFCHQMEPHFRQFARDFQGTVLFVRMDILANSWTPERYGVRSTPTFKFFCDGKPVQELVGAVYPAILKRVIKDVLVHGKECAKNSTAIDYEITGYG